MIGQHGINPFCEANGVLADRVRDAGSLTVGALLSHKRPSPKFPRSLSGRCPLETAERLGI